MREVTVTVTGVNHSGRIDAKQQVMWVKPEKSDIEIMKDAVDELELTGNGFQKIFSITLSN